MIIERTTTIVLNGKTKAEYEAIRARLAADKAEENGWKLILEPVRNCVTAIKTEQVTI